MADFLPKIVSLPESGQDENLADPGLASRIKIVQRLFADLFQFDAVQPDDDFFRLGGDSLMAETLMIEIEREFGVVLSISALLQASTPYALAGMIDQAANKKTTPVLSAIRNWGNELPIYCVHGVTGTSVFPKQIDSVLKGENRLYGLRALGLETGERPLTTIRAMAHHYRKIINEKGSCVLLGHCGGSMIAYEMARMRIAMGEPVSGLIMIDPEIDWRAEFLHKPKLRAILQHWKMKRRAASFAWKLKKHSHAVSKKDRHGRVNQAMNFAVANYRPKKLDCPTLFIYSPERKSALLDPRRGYQNLLPRGHFVGIDVSHEKLFQDRMENIGRAIRQFLDRIEAGE